MQIISVLDFKREQKNGISCGIIMSRCKLNNTMTDCYGTWAVPSDAFGKHPVADALLYNVEI